MTEAEFRVANAAILLGDPVVPPLGSCINLNGIDGYWVSLVVHNFYTGGMTVYLHQLSWDSCGRGGNYNYTIPGNDYVQLVSVPDDVPPFEEWERVDD